MLQRRCLAAMCLLAVAAVPLPCAASPTSEVFGLDSGVELPYHRHVAHGDQLFLWLPSGAGLQAAEAATANGLAAAGVEVWRVDPFDAYFLPVANSSLAQIPAADIAALVEHARARTGKRVYLVSGGRGAVLALRGARHWQQQHPDTPGLGGAILISPNFFVETPDPGLDPELMPVVRGTNLPVYILQPDLSPWRWKLSITVPALEQGGSDVFVRFLRGVRGRFNFRPDANEREHVFTARLPAMMVGAVQMLETLNDLPRVAVAMQVTRPEARLGKKDRDLAPYRGDPLPPELRLPSLDGRVRDLAGFKGQVVLVNFWASWCPPCVHEMPSMQRLQQQLSDRPFTIIAVNMAEDIAIIDEFLETEVAVDFPILLDSDGAALQRWKVFAFPTSFLIGPAGRIRYAVFGAVEWDEPRLVNTIEALLEEAGLPGR